jgi:hypothetical protein
MYYGTNFYKKGENIMKKFLKAWVAFCIVTNAITWVLSGSAKQMFKFYA